MPFAYAGKLAIVIDDVGYRVKEDSEILAMPKEISVAIIPVAPYAKMRAEEAFSQNRDILIHLPMEPKSKQLIEAGGIKIGDGEEEIRKLIDISRSQVPYAIGLNNHMGSGATSDKATMSNLMTVLRENQLLFLDSKTIGSSVAAKIAYRFGIAALERDIFLDDSDELIDVQKQFNAAIAYARKNGVAVVIGHPRQNTIKVLKQGIKKLPKDITLVGIGTLWQNEKESSEKRFQRAATTSIYPYISIPLLRGIPK